jgi:hypothetical protein
MQALDLQQAVTAKPLAHLLDSLLEAPPNATHPFEVCMQSRDRLDSRTASDKGASPTRRIWPVMRAKLRRLIQEEED